MRQQDDGVLSSPLSQGSDSGETPLFVGFSHLGNMPVVEQHWYPHRVYTHFLWHHVAEMMNEPQSGTITFGLMPRPSYTCRHFPDTKLMSYLMTTFLYSMTCMGIFQQPT